MNSSMIAFFDRQHEVGFKLTYDDVRLKTQESDVEPRDPAICLQSQFSRNTYVNTPMISSPMDTVTEASMAIAMAEYGALGVIHRGLDPEAQAKVVARVKHWKHGRIDKPITVRPEQTVAEVLAMQKEKGYTFHTFPVVQSEGKLVGLVARHDFDFCTDTSQTIGVIMTPISQLTSASIAIPQEDAYKQMLCCKRKVLPLVDEVGVLKGLFLFSDLKRIFSSNGSDQSTDKKGQLMVGAAVGTGKGALERAERLVPKGCNVLQVDTAHGHSKNVLKTIRLLKGEFPDVDVVAGNVSSGDGAKYLVDVGVDGVLVGQGPGSICTTRIVAGIGVPQVSAIFDCAQALEGSGVPICADGGIKNSGDMVIAFAVGADTVMLGSALAGTKEAPGEVYTLQGVRVKSYRGMGSFGAMIHSASSRERYGQSAGVPSKLVPEGVEGVVQYRGPISEVLDQYVGGIRAGMGYNGARTLSELRERAEIFRISPAGLSESHPHGLLSMSESPSYRR